MEKSSFLAFILELMKNIQRMPMRDIPERFNRAATAAVTVLHTPHHIPVSTLLSIRVASKYRRILRILRFKLMMTRKNFLSPGG